MCGHVWQSCYTHPTQRHQAGEICFWRISILKVLCLQLFLLYIKWHLYRVLPSCLQQVNKCTFCSAFGRNFVVFEVLREDEFSPLKNADGAATDSPTTARNALLAQHSRWATAAGATLLDEHGNLIPPTARSEDNVLINTLLYQIMSKNLCRAVLMIWWLNW